MSNIVHPASLDPALVAAICYCNHMDLKMLEQIFSREVEDWLTALFPREQVLLQCGMAVRRGPK